MDKSWISAPRNSDVFIKGFEDFLKFANQSSIDGNIHCPCKECRLRHVKSLSEVENDVCFKGFWQEYKFWHHHGEEVIQSRSKRDGNLQMGSTSTVIGQDDMGGLLRDVFRANIINPFNEGPNGPNGEQVLGDEFDGGNFENPSFDEQANLSFSEEVARYQKLIEDCEEALYPGCTSFSKLSFVLRLLHLKCMFGWSAESLTMLLKLLIEAFPLASSFPKSCYEAKRMLKGLDLKYEKIHACPNDCMLYWREQENQQSCHVCGTSRWKEPELNVSGGIGEVGNSKKPAKVMRYFPLIPRLKRIYMSSKLAENMRWHDKDRRNDGILRHPADGLAWKDFDIRYPSFASDPRNIRLGLASDGFNPFHTMSTTYSTWPVIIIPYNLPPWLCMKQTSLILSTIIPGEKGPGNDIDVYLQPLIHELKLLWDGVNAFDAFTKQEFKMRAALMWTINDFPAYGNLSGWSTKGRYACPCCAESTHSHWLTHGRKFCYMGHRRWLPSDHIFRHQFKEFNGHEEYGHIPMMPSGTSILRKLEGINYLYGKKSKPSRKRVREEVGMSSQGIIDEDDNINLPIPLDDGDDLMEDDFNSNEQDILWKKKSIFFELPYWQYHSLRHNLDVMHIEKNVCDNLVGTLLNSDGKSKDNEKARRDLKEMGIRNELHPIERPNNKVYLPPASYTMSPEGKLQFLKVLKHLKVPDGYASNISRCVNLKERRLSNLKSHDCHILMQDILSIALRASRSIEIVELISELCSFFKSLCSKNLVLSELDVLQSRVIITLCQMEKEFPPSFFTIMVHLIIHLVEEAKVGGPVHYRWMYPIERFLVRLKDYVRNRAQPEGSMAEGYIIDECLTFCSRYFEGVQTLFNRPSRNDDSIVKASKYLFNCGGRSVGREEGVYLDDKSLEQAHRYVLLHVDELDKFREDFLSQKRRESEDKGIRVDQIIQNKWMVEEFSQWLQAQVTKIDRSTEKGEFIRSLSRGPDSAVKKMKGFIISGYKFITKDYDGKRKTQNSGVMVEADGETYYGKLKDIFEINYFGGYKVVVFRCDWVDIRSPRALRQDRNGFTCINFSKLMHTGQFLKDDPFIFSSQAKQVFYVEDGKENGWLHVIRIKPRDLYELGMILEDVDNNDNYIECVP